MRPLSIALDCFAAAEREALKAYGTRRWFSAARRPTGSRSSGRPGSQRERAPAEITADMPCIVTCAQSTCWWYQTTPHCQHRLAVGRTPLHRPGTI